MSKLTREDYETALKSRKMFADWIGRENKRRDKLLDELLDTRESIKAYKAQYDKVNETIMLYEMYVEVEKTISNKN